MSKRVIVAMVEGANAPVKVFRSKASYNDWLEQSKWTDEQLLLYDCKVRE